MSTDRPSMPRPSSPSDQAHETDDAWPVIGAGPLTHAMARGALLWGGLGALTGVCIGLLASLIPVADLNWGARAAIFGVVGALAGATAGFIYGGGREPEVEGDVGNQIGPAALGENRRDPHEVREAVDEFLDERGRPRASDADRSP